LSCLGFGIGWALREGGPDRTPYSGRACVIVGGGEPYGVPPRLLGVVSEVVGAVVGGSVVVGVQVASSWSYGSWLVERYIMQL
jgi:hypothetical protein